MNKKAKLTAIEIDANKASASNTVLIIPRYSGLHQPLLL